MRKVIYSDKYNCGGGKEGLSGGRKMNSGWEWRGWCGIIIKVNSGGKNGKKDMW